MLTTIFPLIFIVFFAACIAGAIVAEYTDSVTDGLYIVAIIAIVAIAIIA